MNFPLFSHLLLGWNQQLFDIGLRRGLVSFPSTCEAEATSDGLCLRVIEEKKKKSDLTLKFGVLEWSLCEIFD